MSQNASSSQSAPIHLHSLGRGRVQAESTVPEPAGLPQPLTSLVGRGADFAELTGLTSTDLTFDTAGEYPNYCALHSRPTMGMRGTIVVSAS